MAKAYGDGWTVRHPCTPGFPSPSDLCKQLVMLGEQSGFRGTIRERRQAGGKESESQHTLLLHTAGEAEWIKACSEGQRQNLEPKQSFKFGRFFRYCPRSCSQQARKGFFSQSGHSANQKGFLVEKQHFLPWSTSRIDGYSNPFFSGKKAWPLCHL